MNTVIGMNELPRFIFLENVDANALRHSINLPTTKSNLLNRRLSRIIRKVLAFLSKSLVEANVLTLVLVPYISACFDLHHTMGA